MNLKTRKYKQKKRAVLVMVLGVAGIVLGFGLLVKDFFSIYSLAGRSSGFCEQRCLSSEMAANQLNRIGTLRNIDIAIMLIGVAMAVLGIVLLVRAQKHTDA